jgi:hypothetical protein
MPLPRPPTSTRGDPIYLASDAIGIYRFEDRPKAGVG